MTTFEALGLSQDLLNNLTEMGFVLPTPIQQQTIPFLLKEKRDLLAMAQTGTGKTAAFGLPLIELCDHTKKDTQALVIAPTRELCVQIMNDLKAYSKNVKPLNIVAVYGGASISDQIKALKRGANIIVATPGRLMDLMDRKALSITTIEYAVLDEADEMLNMGFQEDIQKILADTPETKNVWLFSATMPIEVRRIANKYMNSPMELSVSKENMTNTNIAHQFAVISERDRYNALKRIIDHNIEMFGVIFCRTKNDTQMVAEKLIADGYNADSLHGDLSQGQRDKVMRSFRNKSLQILVATDVAARGIDVNNITHVLHMNLPDEMEFYTHRSGRTARAGKTGTSIALVTSKEAFKIRQIEKSIKVQFEKISIPTGEEVCQVKMLHLVHRLREVEMADDSLMPFLPKVYEELHELSKEDIIKRFAYLEFNHLLDYYRGATDLNLQEKHNINTERQGERRFESPSRGESRSYGSGDRLFINLGKADGLEKGGMLGLICDRARINKSAIGRIDLKGVYSFIEVEPDAIQPILSNLNGFEYKGRIIRIEQQATEPKRSNGSITRSRSDRGGERSEGFGGSRSRSGEGRNSEGRSSEGRSSSSRSSAPRNSSFGGGERRSSSSRGDSERGGSSSRGSEGRTRKRI
jgi:ATP-dependent RNA helicase DeaD